MSSKHVVITVLVLSLNAKPVFSLLVCEVLMVTVLLCQMAARGKLFSWTVLSHHLYQGDLAQALSFHSFHSRRCCRDLTFLLP